MNEFIFCGEPDKYIWTEEDKARLKEALAQVFGWEIQPKYIGPFDSKRMDEVLTKIPQITAAMVSELRVKTNCPMMECKKALHEAEGDMVKAEEILRLPPMGNRCRGPATYRKPICSADGCRDNGNIQ